MEEVRIDVANSLESLPMESVDEVTEAHIDEIQDDLEVRIDFANVTRDKQITFSSGFPGLQGVS